jgi:lysyl-tRNA synthetase class 2
LGVYRFMPSSVIRRFSYRADRRELEVTFVTGRIYVYRDVPEQEVEALRAASSKGRYFNAHIRDHYAYNEVTEELHATS